MGRSSDDIKQEIEDQREVIAEKLEHLGGRIESDVDEAQEAAKKQITSAFGLDNAVRRRMPMVIAGAFGGAVLLGVATGARRNR